MKPLISCCFLFFFVSFAWSQFHFAIIQDPDGYTNVRKAPNSSSEVLVQVFENELFVVYDVVEKDWGMVSIFSNPYSMACQESSIEGYMHLSRIKKLDDVPQADKQNFSFDCSLSSFDPFKKRLSKSQEGWIIAINGRPFWGTDGGLPKSQVNGISYTINGESFQIPSIFFEDLFEFSERYWAHRQGDTYFVRQMHSDGAGGYELFWVLNKQGVQQRLIWRP
ncbi:MAG: hypothetical protein AAF587_25655 [Bacteroidota bacterium]